jgi:LCP family protein required for cell wall assembly
MGVRSPQLAAALSFALPGLGEYATGSRRLGLLLAVPAIVVLVLAIGMLALAASVGELAVLDLLLRPEIVLSIVALDLLALGYHVGSIADAWQLARHRAAHAPLLRPRRARGSVVALAVLLAVTAGVHGAIAAAGIGEYVALGAVFRGDGDGAWTIPEPSFEPATPSPSPTPVPTVLVTTPPSAPAAAGPEATATASPTPAPTPEPTAVPKWAKDGRLNLLLIGSDAGPDRWLLRTDTVLVLSVDAATGRAALFGIPRNMVGVPLPPESAGAFSDGRFPGMLNALYVYAWGHPRSFPGGEARGFRAVAGAVQELVGVPLDGAIAVNLHGFVRLVDAMGGLWIDVPERVIDERYPKEDGSGLIRLDIRPGCQHLDGSMALAYARSRHQDSDYGRMRRQQVVLRALRSQLDPIALLPQVPELLSIARDDLWTSIPRAAIPSMAELAARVDGDTIQSILFAPSRYPSHLDDAGIDRIRKVVRGIFDGPVPAATPTPVPEDMCGP